MTVSGAEGDAALQYQEKAVRLWEEGATMPGMMRIARRDEIARQWLGGHGKRKEDR